MLEMPLNPLDALWRVLILTLPNFKKGARAMTPRERAVTPPIEIRGESRPGKPGERLARRPITADAAAATGRYPR
jgi:hypothetical protein